MSVVLASFKMIAMAITIAMVSSSCAFVTPHQFGAPPPILQCTRTRLLIASTGAIDWQSDEDMYGRGEMHLSAILQEGDAVVYQTGTWEVDGVQVGDGTPAVLRYAKVDTIQLVWTHNCEHGVIRGVAAFLNDDDDDDDHCLKLNNTTEKKGNIRFVVESPLEDVEFGPEQLMARLPVHWDYDEGEITLSEYEQGDGGDLLVEIPPDLVV